MQFETITNSANAHIVKGSSPVEYGEKHRNYELFDPDAIQMLLIAVEWIVLLVEIEMKSYTWRTSEQNFFCVLYCSRWRHQPSVAERILLCDRSNFEYSYFESSAQNLKVRFLRKLINYNLNTKRNQPIFIFLGPCALSHVNVQSHGMNHARQNANKNWIERILLLFVIWAIRVWTSMVWTDREEKTRKVNCLHARCQCPCASIQFTSFEQQTNNDTDEIANTTIANGNVFKHNAIDPLSMDELKWMVVCGSDWRRMSDMITTEMVSRHETVTDYDVTICHLVHVFMEFR